MKLTEKERAVIAGLELRAEVPIGSIIGEIGLREHTVRYHLKNLIERGILTPLPFINVHRLGLMIFNLFFSIGAEKRTKKEALVEFLRSSPEVIWIGEFGGEFQYGIAVCVKNLFAVHEFLSTVSKRFSTIFFEKAVSSQFGTRVFHRKYLSSKRFSATSLACSVTKDTVEIDDRDHAILIALANAGGLSRRRLAQSMGIPLSSLELRIKKLESKGVITGYYYAVDASRFGMQSFKLLVYGKGLDAALRSGVLKFCISHPHVTYLIECFGSWDFEIGVEAEHPVLVMEIVSELNEMFGASLNTIKILSKFGDLKVRWFFGAQ